jgi:UDP-glucose-4-epimerase GalE
MKVLVTGGAGYIGSITSHLLSQNGCEIVVVDNLSNGHREALPADKTVFRECDLLDAEELNRIFQNENPEAVIHFAGLIQVGESIQQPLKYYQNNVGGTLNLLSAMKRSGCRRIVFSSSAAVYGNPFTIPINEGELLKPVNPYGHSKQMAEQLLIDSQQSGDLNFFSLRYFNAAGAEYGIGESHSPETHLIPLALHAIQTGKPLSLYGNDYPTPDGTCIRDYIHVGDLAHAHWQALQSLKKRPESHFYNVGTGSGNSVLEIIHSIEDVTGEKVPVEIKPRRAGDPERLVADNHAIQSRLGWAPQKSLNDIVQSAWEWEQTKKF